MEAGLAADWSPQQVAHRLRLDHPDDLAMRVSHETIYLSIFQPTRKALPSGLHRHLRSSRTMRLPRIAKQPQGRGRIKDMTSIHDRPAEVEDRQVPGSLEGDLVMGRRPSAVATLVERPVGSCAWSRYLPGSRPARFGLRWSRTCWASSQAGGAP